MATALQHVFTVPGIVLPIREDARELQQVTTKFWGVRGESRIVGGTAGRFIQVPVLVYGEQFNTQEQLCRWFDDLWQYQGRTGTLIVTSAANRPPYIDTSFDSAALVSDPKMDEAGTLGFGAFVEAFFLFRQHT